MIIWDLVLIMKPLVVGVQPWPTVLMVQGLNTNHGYLYSKSESYCIVELYYMF